MFGSSTLSLENENQMRTVQDGGSKWSVCVCGGNPRTDIKVGVSSFT